MMGPREDWKPVLTINSIIYGLQYLFLVSTAGVQTPVAPGDLGTPPGCTRWPWDTFWGHPVMLNNPKGAPSDLMTPRGGTLWSRHTTRWPMVATVVAPPNGLSHEDTWSLHGDTGWF
uniref:Uncharacterized protein n=1 Tax=Buteo japonicus TaxID=224669 RepID=A0A8C0BHV5_9AVES